MILAIQILLTVGCFLGFFLGLVKWGKESFTSVSRNHFCPRSQCSGNLVDMDIPYACSDCAPCFLHFQ